MDDQDDNAIKKMTQLSTQNIEALLVSRLVPTDKDLFLLHGLNQSSFVSVGPKKHNDKDRKSQNKIGFW